MFLAMVQCCMVCPAACWQPNKVNSALGVSNDVIIEQSYLVARGVRPLALLGHVENDPLLMLEVATRIETLAEKNVTPFVLDRGDGMADVGYAAAPWVADTFRWASREAASPHANRVIGILLGYSADAIADFESQQSIRWFNGPLSRLNQGPVHRLVTP